MSPYGNKSRTTRGPLCARPLSFTTYAAGRRQCDDGGDNWRALEVGDLPGVPDTAFVNDIKADLYDADTVYVALDNHKYGDYQPYLLKSTDRGRSWRSIARTA